MEISQLQFEELHVLALLPNVVSELVLGNESGDFLEGGG
jgi:hypothetical protein